MAAENEGDLWLFGYGWGVLSERKSAAIDHFSGASFGSLRQTSVPPFDVFAHDINDQIAQI